MASCRVFGVSDDHRLNDQDQSSQPPGQQFDLGDSESSSLADLFKLDKSELFYYNNEKKSGKPGAGDAGGNRTKCRRYRTSCRKNELKALKDRYGSLWKLQMDLARSLEMTRELYLKWIISGKMSFSSS